MNTAGAAPADAAALRARERAGATAGRWAWWLSLAALALRLGFALEAPRRIVWNDGREYEATALSLLHEGSYGLHVLRPPGYPTLMAAVWSVTGHDLLALRIVEAVLGAFAVWLIARAGIRRFGPVPGVIAAALAAFHPVLAFLPTTQYTENTLLPIMVGLFACVFAALDRPAGAWRWWLAGGALLGVALLWRPNVALAVPGLFAGAALALARERRRWLAPLALATLAAVVVITPWLVRNHQVHHRWYFIATGGGRALWLGNNPQLTPAHYRNAHYPPELVARLQAGDWFADDALLRREALAEIRRDPPRAATLYAVKLGKLMALWPETQTRTRWMNDLARWSQGLVSALVFAGALLALPRLGRLPLLWPLALGFATYVLAHAVFFTTMRYRMPVEPVLLWMAGVGWAGVLARRPGAGPARHSVL